MRVRGIRNGRNVESGNDQELTPWSWILDHRHRESRGSVAGRNRVVQEHLEDTGEDAILGSRRMYIVMLESGASRLATMSRQITDGIRRIAATEIETGGFVIVKYFKNGSHLAFAPICQQ